MDKEYWIFIKSDSSFNYDFDGYDKIHNRDNSNDEFCSIEKNIWFRKVRSIEDVKIAINKILPHYRGDTSCYAVYTGEFDLPIMVRLSEDNIINGTPPKDVGAISLKRMFSPGPYYKWKVGMWDYPSYVTLFQDLGTILFSYFGIIAFGIIFFGFLLTLTMDVGIDSDFSLFIGAFSGIFGIFGSILFLIGTILSVKSILATIFVLLYYFYFCALLYPALIIIHLWRKKTNLLRKS